MKDPELVQLVQSEKDRDNTVAIKTYSQYSQGGLKEIGKMLAFIFSTMCNLWDSTETNLLYRVSSRTGSKVTNKLCLDKSKQEKKR